MSIFETAVYVFAVIGFLSFVSSLFFKKKPEPLDSLIYLPRAAREIGVRMESKLENGVMTLWVIKPDTEESIQIALFNFDDKVRQFRSEDKAKAVIFVRDVTQWNLMESKNYVDNLV